MQPIVYIIDDDRLARESLQWLIESAGQAVRVFENGMAFLDHYKIGDPGCVVLDVRMPDINGMELHAKLRECGADIPVIIVTGHADVAMAVRAMKASAWDFIEKPYNDALMLERVQGAIAYDRDNRRNQERVDEIRQRSQLLTPREREVMGHVIRSSQNKVIAQALGISVKTVELHRANLMTKMEAISSTELVRLAMIADLE
ncbi:MAG: response regulator [Gammaproteobacteria bacterium]|nr:response regulator [Gammaproteobacteria bacterium]